MTPAPRSSRTASSLLQTVVDALDDRKAVDVVVMDLRALSDATDYFVIATGTSDTHVRAIAQHVIEVTSEADQAPHHTEGVSAGRWALVDFVDVIVHVFQPAIREFYQLERLWADAPRLSAGGSV